MNKEELIDLVRTAEAALLLCKVELQKGEDALPHIDTAIDYLLAVRQEIDFTPDYEDGPEFEGWESRIS